MFFPMEFDHTPHPFTLALLHWFASHQRQMPWRQTRDPYAVWLSEVILQQTRVQQGWAYYERFMERFPTVETLAAATEDEVLRQWQGLGYYSRARHLHAAARQVVAAGRFPDTAEGWLKLSGVGPYTAAAIASFAFDQPCAALDGNAFRVLARQFGISLPIGSSEGRKTFETLAEELLPADRSRDFNLALMDFGSLQCSPSSPDCGSCPLAESCIACREGRTGELPVRGRKTAVHTRRLAYVYLRHQGFTAFRQRSAGDIYARLWEPLDGASASEAGWSGDGLLARGVKHQLTHLTLIADFYLWEPTVRPSLPPEYQWIAERDLPHYALPRLIEKLIAPLQLPPIGGRVTTSL